MSDGTDQTERLMIDQLRAEARDVKQCFTTFCFQSLALASTVLALTIGAMRLDQDLAAYMPLPLIIALMSVARLAPLFVKILHNPLNARSLLDCSVLVSIFLVIGLRQRRLERRRVILERELLSIHSCAIVWQAVALIHHRALHEANGLYDHYTEKVARLAAELAENAFDIREWLGRSIKRAA